MAKLPLPADLLKKVAPLLGKLPFLPKKKARPRSRADEPFESLEDSSPESDESFEPNALPGAHRAETPGIDWKGLVHGFLHNRLFVGIVAAFLLFAIVLVATSIIAGAPPAADKAISRPITEEGRAAARRFLLPADPALDLEPPMTREPRFPYTDEDMKRFAPEHDPRSLPDLMLKNDQAIEALFGTVK
jgi:hypothetical protein